MEKYEDFETWRKKSCEEKIDKELEGRIKDIKEALKRADEDEEFDLFEWINEYFLAWDGYRLELSWGGPADGFLLARDKENYLVDIRYYYSDWGDYAERRLFGGNFDLIEDLYERCLRCTVEN